MNLGIDRYRGKTSAGHNPLIQGLIDGVVGGLAFSWAAPTRGRIMYDKLPKPASGEKIDHRFPNRGVDYYETFTTFGGYGTDGDYLAQDAFFLSAAATVAVQVGTLVKIGGPVALAAPVLTNAVSGLYETVRGTYRNN